MTPEGAVRSHLRKQARGAGFEHRKLKWIGRNGAPDEFIFWPVCGEWPIAAYVEVKREGESPEPHQQREIDRLRAAGFRVEVVDSKEGCDRLINELTWLVRECQLREQLRG